MTEERFCPHGIPAGVGCEQCHDERETADDQITDDDFRDDVPHIGHRACALVWGDGWGDHTCSRPEGHDGGHRCTCDTWTTAPSDQYAQPHEDNP